MLTSLGTLDVGQGSEARPLAGDGSTSRIRDGTRLLSGMEARTLSGMEAPALCLTATHGWCLYACVRAFAPDPDPRGRRHLHVRYRPRLPLPLGAPNTRLAVLTLAEPYGLVRKTLIKRNRGLTELQLNLKGFQFLNINI